MAHVHWWSAKSAQFRPVINLYDEVDVAPRGSLPSATCTASHRSAIDVEDDDAEDFKVVRIELDIVFPPLSARSDFRPWALGVVRVVDLHIDLGLWDILQVRELGLRVPRGDGLLLLVVVVKDA